MTTMTSYGHSLTALLAMAVCVWLLASARRNAGLVDIFWPLFFLAAAVVHTVEVPNPTWRAYLALGLVSIWAARLALHLTLRNWGAPEDHRYRAIRARNEPGFVWKSIYLVFGLQAVLAWLIATPVAAAILSPSPLRLLDVLGASIVLAAIVLQALADGQLTRFKADPMNKRRVMDRGLWKYSRHPNYFAECCVWWGFYLIAASGGAWWSVFSPLIMTLLLLKVSGVALLEKDIAERRPEYSDYARRTSAFIPWPPRTS